MSPVVHFSIEPSIWQCIFLRLELKTITNSFIIIAFKSLLQWLPRKSSQNMRYRNTIDLLERFWPGVYHTWSTAEIVLVTRYGQKRKLNRCCFGGGLQTGWSSSEVLNLSGINLLFQFQWVRRMYVWNLWGLVLRTSSISWLHFSTNGFFFLVAFHDHRCPLDILI